MVLIAIEKKLLLQGIKSFIDFNNFDGMVEIIWRIEENLRSSYSKAHPRLS